MADHSDLSMETVKAVQSIAATGQYVAPWQDLLNVVSQRLVEVVTSYDRQEHGHGAVGLYTEAVQPNALATSIRTVADPATPANATAVPSAQGSETDAKPDDKETGARSAVETVLISSSLTFGGDASMHSEDTPNLLPANSASSTFTAKKQADGSGTDGTADRVNHAGAHLVSATGQGHSINAAQVAQPAAADVASSPGDIPQPTTGTASVPGDSAGGPQQQQEGGAANSVAAPPHPSATSAQAGSTSGDDMEVDCQGTAAVGEQPRSAGRVAETAQETAGLSARSAHSHVSMRSQGSGQTSSAGEDGTGTVAADSLVMEGSQGELATYIMSVQARQDLEELHELLFTFDEEAPWTLQRLCEILGTPRRFYSKLDKLTFGLRKCLAVQTTLPPCRPAQLVQVHPDHPAYTQLGPVPKPTHRGATITTATGLTPGSAGTMGAGGGGLGEEGSPRPQQGMGSMRLTFSDPKTELNGGRGGGGGTGLFYSSSSPGAGQGEDGGEYHHFGAVRLVDEDYDSDSDDDSGSSDSSEDMSEGSGVSVNGGDDGLEAHMHESARRIGQVGRASKGRIERELEQSDMAQALLAGAASAVPRNAGADPIGQAVSGTGHTGAGVDEDDAEDIFPGVGRRLQRPREKSIDEDAYVVEADDEDRFIPPAAHSARAAAGGAGVGVGGWEEEGDKFSAPSVFRKAEEEEDDLFLRGKGAGTKRPASLMSGGAGLGLLSNLGFEASSTSAAASLQPASFKGPAGLTMAGGSSSMALGGISIKFHTHSGTPSSSSSSSPVAPAGPGLALGLAMGMGMGMGATSPSHGSPTRGAGSGRSETGSEAVLSPGSSTGRSLSPPPPPSHTLRRSPGPMSPPGLHNALQRHAVSTAPIAASVLGGSAPWLQPRPPSPPAGSPRGRVGGEALVGTGGGTSTTARPRATSIGEAPLGYLPATADFSLKQAPAATSHPPPPAPHPPGHGPQVTSHANTVGGALSPTSMVDHMFSDHIPPTHAKMILPDHGHGHDSAAAPGSASTVHRLSPAPMVGKGGTRTGSLVAYGMEDGEDSSSSGLSDSSSSDDDDNDRHAKQVDAARQFRRKQLMDMPGRSGSGKQAGLGTATGRMEEGEQETTTDGVEPSPAKKARLE